MALETSRAPLSIEELAAETGYPVVHVRRTLWTLRERQKVCFGPLRRDRCGRAHYQYIPRGTWVKNP